MVHGQAFRADESPADQVERARIQARLLALSTDNSPDVTRRIGAEPAASSPANDGSLGQPVTQHPSGAYDVEPRAFLLTAEGGVLVELGCKADTEPAILGRGQEADIRLADPYVHRQQAKIYWDASVQAHFIAHAGGTNGTYVNRHRVHKPLRLVGGEQIHVGKSKLRYRIRR